MPKFYETDEHRRNARVAMDKFMAGRPGYSALEMPPGEPVNFVLRDEAGNKREVVQVICRGIPRHKYPTLAISRVKIRRLLSYADTHACVATLVVSYIDAVVEMEIIPEEIERLPCQIGGRWDRPDDPASVEAMLHIPKVLLEEVVPCVRVPIQQVLL